MQGLSMSPKSTTGGKLQNPGLARRPLGTMSESLIIKTLCFPLFAVVGFFLTFNNCSCKTHELGYLFHNLPVHTCTPGSGEVDNTAFKPNGHPTSSHPCHCYPSLDRGRQYIRGRIPAFSLLTFTTQHDDEAGKIARLRVHSSGMIRARINDPT